MASGMSWFEGRLRKRPTHITMEELRPKQDVEAAKRKKRQVKKRMHTDLFDGFNAEERAGRAMEVQRRREVANQDDGRVATMVAENQQVESHDEGKRDGGIPTKVVGIKFRENYPHPKENKTSEGENSTMQMRVQYVNNTQENENEKYKEDEGKLVIYYDENQAGIEIVDAADNQEVNQADNQEGKNKNNQGVMEAREVIEVDNEENKVEIIYEPLPAMFHVNEPELPENRYRYVGIYDWPLIWTYEERMMWGLGGLGSAFSNPNVKYWNWFG